MKLNDYIFQGAISTWDSKEVCTPKEAFARLPPSLHYERQEKAESSISGSAELSGAGDAENMLA